MFWRILNVLTKIKFFNEYEIFDWNENVLGETEIFDKNEFFFGNSDILKTGPLSISIFFIEKKHSNSNCCFNQKWCPFIQNTCFFQLKYVPILMKKGMKIKIAEKIIQTIKINLFNNLTEKGIRWKLKIERGPKMVNLIQKRKLWLKIQIYVQNWKFWFKNRNFG